MAGRTAGLRRRLIVRQMQMEMLIGPIGTLKQIDSEPTAGVGAGA